MILTSGKNSCAPRRPVERNFEFFDRHPRLPLLFLALLPIVLHLPLLLLGRTTDPLWFVADLTHAKRLMPSWPFIDPNVGFTSEALGHLAASDWIHGIVPWWNPYSGIGLPLAGELQPGAFFLPFTLLFLLREGVLWQQTAMQIIAGLTTYALLRELGTSRLAALTGGALFALNSVIAWTPGPAAVYCSQPFLPLLLWGIERARRHTGGPLSVVAIGVAIAWSLLAGFPEPAYISGLLALAWGTYRLASEKHTVMARRAIAGWGIGMLVAAPLLIAFVDYIRQSNSFGIHNLGEESLPVPAFSTIVMPYVYGLPQMSFRSPLLSHIWASIGGYAGILIILLAVVGITTGRKQRGLKFLLLTWILLAWAKTFGLKPVITLMNYLPLLRQADFLRYSPPSWGLALVILASFGLDEFRSGAPRRRTAYGISLGLLTIGIVLAWPKHAWWHRPPSIDPIMFVLLIVSLSWALALLLLAGLSWTLLRDQKRRMALACLVVTEAIVLFVIPEASNTRKTPIDVDAIRFLHDHQGLSRNYTLGPIKPNYSAYFQLASIDHNVLPVPKLWADFVDRNLLPGLWTRFSGITFWPGSYGEGEGEQALSRNLANYLNIGVRYVITSHGRSPAPELSLPAAGANSSSSTTGSETAVLNRLSAALDRFCNAAGAKEAALVSCRLAKRLSTFDNPVGHGSDEKKIGLASVGRTPAMSLPLRLDAGQSTTISAVAPAPPIAGFPITAIGVMVESADKSVDGALAVEVCNKSDCGSGERALSELNEDGVFRISLIAPVAAPTGQPLRFTFARRNGTQPLLLRAALAPVKGEQFIAASTVSADRTPQIVIDYGSALQGIREVYSDSLMDIWELPNPAPYFQVIRGGPCRIVTVSREDATADCAATAVLLRRELYMPGWKLRVNGRGVKPVQQEGLFQAAALSAGHNNLEYRFSPPHIVAGWIASSIGLACLLWQIILIGRGRTGRP